MKLNIFYDFHKYITLRLIKSIRKELKMKKTISTLAASVMAVCSLASVSASATDNTNQIDITTETIETSIVADNGVIIPSGATAVTVSISGNTGFSAKGVKLDIGECDVISDVNGTPVVDSGDVIGDSIVGAMENDGVMMIASASADESTEDGDIFTFYVSGESDDISVIDIDPVINTASPMAVRYRYMIGDATGNGVIDLMDASEILTAVSTYQSESNSENLPVSTANANLSHYFSSSLLKVERQNG